MANKKINQLVSKTAILSTDLFGIGDATTGQLFKKTIAELQAAIGGAVISVNGLVGTVVLDTDDIQELATPTNKYFTDARARGAISLTVTGNSGASTYSSGTGVLNVPTYTLAGLGGITASFLSGTSGISYNSTTGVITYSGTVYTDASIRALFSGSTGITYNSSTGAISYSGTVYTDSSVRALISITTTGTSGASTYNNTTGVINVPNYTLAGLGGISLTSLSGGTGITYNSTTGAISYSGTVYTDASVRALISASGAVSYNNTTGVISLTSGNLTEATSSVLTITGGTGAVLGSGTSIQVKQASSTVSGFLSSTDWSTFNGKASALSGTTNYVVKFTSSTGIGNSNLINDASGNLGLGVTPSAWNTAYSVMQIGSGVSIVGYKTSNANELFIGANVFENTSGTWTYLQTTSASQYLQINGSHYWRNAPSGTAGNAITFTQAMTLDASGNLGLGVTPSAWSGVKALQIGNGSLLATGNFVAINSNSFFDGVDKYISNSFASQYYQLSGQHVWQTAPSGTAGAAITFTQAMTLNASGNLGLGTASPLGKLDINTGGNTNIVISNDSTDTGYNIVSLNGTRTKGSYAGIAGGGTSDNNLYVNSASNVVIQTGASFAERMRITSGGIVEINNTDACYINFKTSGTSKAFIGLAGTSSDVISGAAISDIVIRAQQKMLFSTGGDTERMRITSGGNILIGTTSDNGEKLYVSGAIRATGTITANSDLTLKKNLLKIENALEKVEQINGYTYEFKADDSKRHAGVIAQEIQTILPEIVNKGNDGILGVEYGNISALLIEAIKEQQTQINELKALLNK